MPDPQKVLTSLRRATELFRATPGRHGCLITLDDTVEDVLVVGDLHGNIPAFRQALLKADLARHPARHLVLQELIHGPRHYPDDGGDKSHQLVDVVSALKGQFPDRVHLILGNHELSELTNRPIAKGGVALNALFRQGIQTAYGAFAEEIYQAYRDLFAALPLAVRTPNRVFLCHSIPDPIDLEEFDVSIFEAEEWSPESMARHGAVYALTWGRNTDPQNVDRFADLVDADWFITGHQPCDEGFRQANHRQIIIDGTDPYPTCCLFPAREVPTIESLMGGIQVLPMSV
ncbi:metallophosphoesterase [Tundrisphaera lichenicola]|uniref:metallophosphoesterase n=1 Tax=Tundrisphaera lichenicola TaxID=2029860 RepID=UPI003EC09CA2